MKASSSKNLILAQLVTRYEIATCIVKSQHQLHLLRSSVFLKESLVEKGFLAHFFFFTVCMKALVWVATFGNASPPARYCSIPTVASSKPGQAVAFHSQGVDGDDSGAWRVSLDVKTRHDWTSRA